MIREQTIGNKKFEFEFTNRSFFKLDEKFDKAGEIFNGVLLGNKHISNSVKLISVSCKSEEVNEEYILNNASPSEFMKLSSLANNLVLDYFGIKEKASKEDNTKKK